MLKLIGYWQQEFKGPYDDEYDWPHPKYLTNEAWEKANRQQIVQYLQNGVWVYEELGFSYCRFEPDLDNRLMGCKELTDGEWIWPEGLAHYIEKHSVILPDEFIETLKRNHFQIPEGLNPSDLEKEEVDLTFWDNWCKK